MDIRIDNNIQPKKTKAGSARVVVSISSEVVAQRQKAPGGPIHLMPFEPPKTTMESFQGTEC